ncbi:putative transcriptional regulator [Pyrobaculum spherical virus 2]|uniref:Putative transcriptional regulator n=1 Tax=Pyrobaculum spherical virus 2 TaxID=2730632 RepID=A0A6M3VX71_9VIRU|nr:putative transcriptional regulator [Pyrobaculum spherical virus 2]QJF12444.1 putative transcriptional regulator [Pyrobaculum spherical virus 2]
MPKNLTNRVKQWIIVLARLDRLITLTGVARQHNIPHSTAHHLVRLLKGIIEARKIGGVIYIAPYGKFDEYAAQWGKWFYEMAVRLLNGCRSQCCRVPISTVYKYYRTKIIARAREELGLLRPIGITAFIYYSVKAYKEDAAEIISEKPFIKVCRGKAHN